MSNEIVTALITSLIGGILVAAVNHFFTRRRTEAETAKFKAEADKITAEAEKTRAETNKLLAELHKLNANVEEASYYRLSDTREKLIFDSKQGIDQFDIEAQGAVISNDETRQLGQGSFMVKQGTVILERTNSSGAYSLTLRSYSYNGKKGDVLPKNELLSGKRKLRFSCEAKVTKGTSYLMVALVEHPSKSDLEVRFIDVAQEDWMPLDLYFRVSPSVDCYLQLHEVKISEPNTLLLRNLLLAERQE